jgi:hypothetical protein
MMDSLRPEIRTPSDPKALADPDNDLRRSGIRSLVVMQRALWLDIAVSTIAGVLVISLYVHLAPVVARMLDLSFGLTFDIPAASILAGIAFALTLLLLRKHSTRH